MHAILVIWILVVHSKIAYEVIYNQLSATLYAAISSINYPEKVPLPERTLVLAEGWWAPKWSLQKGGFSENH